MEQMRQKLVGFIGVVLVLASTACTIVDYSFTPADKLTLDRPLASNVVLPIYFPQSFFKPLFDRNLAGPIQKGLTGDSFFQEAVLVTRRLDTGTFVSITIDEAPTKIGPS